MSNWSDAYIGLPWQDRGRTHAGCDCYGLVRLVYAERLGIELPAYGDYSSAEERSETHAALTGAMEAGGWQEVTPADPLPFDVAVFRRGRLASHIGLVVSPGTMLHMADEDCAKLERYDAGCWRHRLTGIWRRRPAHPAPPVPVLAAPLFDAGAGRIETELPHGLTLAEIVAAVLPGASATDNIRVSLVTDRGAEWIAPVNWPRIRPRPGVRVVIRVVPGKSALRSILMIAVTVAAVALGGPWGAQLATVMGWSTATGVSLVTAGLSMVGSLVVNALVPPVRPDNEKRRERYTISGFRNGYTPDGAVPVVLGTHRYAPPFAATSWTEVVGDWQYVRALFCCGYGPVQLSDLRLGATAISEYDEVEIETREGRPGDAPTSLYPRQVIEESVAAELTRPLPRDDAGEVIDGPAKATPVVRTTAADSVSASVILTWPGGLIRVDGDGDRRTETVRIRIEQRLVDGNNWQLVRELEVRARRQEPFFRQHSWTFPQRGRWQVRLTMLTDESEDIGRQRRTVWVALQSFRPEYPLAMRDPLALVALRIKATHQLSGQLDDFSAVLRSVCLDYDRATRDWVARPTSNPAALYRYVLQHPANPRPVPDSGLDLAQFEDWHEFCRQRGLAYDRVLDDPGLRLREVLTEIAAAGRATPRHDGLRWGVTIDRPGQLIVDHISPRNSWEFRAVRSYGRRPDGLRVRFNDAANDYKPAERLIRRPGHQGEIVLTEVLDLPGKTSAEEVWREATRRLLEAEHRPDVFEVMQDGPVRVATRGDRVAISADVLDDVQRAATVLEVIGREITLDDEVSVEAGSAYAVRFRVPAGSDPLGASVVCAVDAPPGATRLLTLAGTGPLPAVGELVLFGRAGRETHSAIVTAVETGEDLTCLVRAVPEAPEIDTRLAALPVPAWSSRVGAELAPSALAPAAPRFLSVRSGLNGTGTAGRIDILLAPGSGPVATAGYSLRHGPQGGAQTVLAMPAADGGVALSYDQGVIVTLQAQATSHAGVPGAWGPVIVHTVGGADTPIPAALPASRASLVQIAGAVELRFATGADPALRRVQVWRGTTATFGEAAKSGAAVSVSASSTYAVPLGTLPEGSHHVWLEPLNANNLGGPVTGPLTIDIA